jgi:hypothetical protein
VSREKPVAKKDPFLHWRDVPSHKRNTFLNTVKTLAEWTTLFNDTLHELKNKDAELQEEKDVEKDEIFCDNPTLPPSRGQCNEIQFSWDLGEDDAPQGSPSPAHRAALELPRSACDDQVARSWEQKQAIREIKDLLSSQATDFSFFEQWMGQINYLVSKHGSVADAVEQALNGGNFADATAINEQMKQFHNDLEAVTNKAETSKDTILQLLLKVREAGSWQCKTLERHVCSVEFHHTDKTPLSLGQGTPSLPPVITADMVFGVGQVRGVDFKLSINLLFGLVLLVGSQDPNPF